ncbi:MAG: hypothetical protein ABIJ91_05435 [Candidatus Kuenenbacteria bacterium]
MDKKPTKGEYLEVLLRSPKTVFSINDVTLLWGEERKRIVAVRLNKYAKAGKLIRLRRGVYAKDKNYDRLELATRIYTPSYISFETVLTRAGINFQKYDSIFVASYVTREIKVDGQTILYIRMKDYVLSNTTGVDQNGNVAIATKERAFLDRIYISKDYHFDNLDGLDWDKIFEILQIYNNKRMEKKVNVYFKEYKKAKL